MLKVIVGIIVLAAVCRAQKHITCSIADEVLTQKSQQTTQRALQGSQGKRGPKGQMGPPGMRGQKGEPGIPDDRQINLFQDQFNILSQELESLKNQSRQNYQNEKINLLFQEVEALKNQSEEIYKLIDHIRPNAYDYKVTPGTQSWQESQKYCQNWGGTLAVYGVKTMENRKKLIQNLSINYWFWIGLNDIASDGNWTWVNGERASSSELIWWNGRPAHANNNEDCVELYGNPGHSHNGRMYDIPCSTNGRRGLCEKQI